MGSPPPLDLPARGVRTALSAGAARASLVPGVRPVGSCLIRSGCFALPERELASAHAAAVRCKRAVTPAVTRQGAFASMSIIGCHSGVWSVLGVSCFVARAGSRHTRARSTAFRRTCCAVVAIRKSPLTVPGRQRHHGRVSERSGDRKGAMRARAGLGPIWRATGTAAVSTLTQPAAPREAAGACFGCNYRVCCLA